MKWSKAFLVDQKANQALDMLAWFGSGEFQKKINFHDANFYLENRTELKAILRHAKIDALKWL